MISPSSLLYSWVAVRLRRRHLLIPCILVAQASLLALISLHPDPVKAVPAQINVIDVQGPSDTPTDPVPKPKPVPPPELIPVEAPVLAIEPVETLAVAAEPVFSADAAASAGFGTTCDIAETLERAFAQDELIKGELSRIKPESRSVSNAIMVWDARWVELPGEAPKEAVATLQRGIMEAVKAAPIECLVQDLAGPRFIFAGDVDSRMILVIGSGAWRWEQLLDEAEDSPGTVSLAQIGQGR